MRLFHAHQSRSARVRWMFEELGIPYTLERVSLGADKSAEHLEHHPHGGIPALVIDGRSMIESAAMIFHFGDLHADKGFTPAVGTPDRAKYYEWVIYSVATVDPQLAAIFRHGYKLPEAQRDPVALENARRILATALAHYDRGLGDQPYFLGDSFSLADVGVGWDLNLASLFRLTGDHPRLEAYVKRLRERPAFQRAYAD